MNEYIHPNGYTYTEDELISSAKDENMTLEDFISNRGIKPKKPGKPKTVAKVDAGATVKSTVSKSVKPSSVSQDNVWGETKSQPDFVTNLEKATAPIKKDNKLSSFEARSTGNIAPNSDQAWIPSIANYKKAGASETEIPKEFLKKSLEYLKTKEGVKFEIEKQDLDLKDPNLYYSTSKKGDEFVNQNYNSDKLKKLGINPDDFDGFINKKGYKDDFINKDQSGAFQRNWLEKFEDIAPEWMGRSTQSQEEVQFKKEKILNNYLNLYLKDKDKNANLYKQLKDKELNPEKDWQEINKTNKEVPVIDPNSVSEYNKTMFPTIAKIDANKIIEDKKIVEHLRTRSTPMAALEETWGFGKELVGSMWNTSKELIATGQDLIGLDKEADVIRSQTAYDEYKNPDTRGIGGFIKGKSTTIDGIKYQTDDAGNIYNVTHGFNIAGLVDDSEYQNIKKGIQENGKEDWYISPRGAAKSTAQVLGAMVPQIVLTEMTMGLGGAIGTRALATRAGFSSIAEYKNMVNLSEAVGGKVLSKMPLPVTKDMAGAIVTQSAFGYSNGYEQTLKAARDAGINDKDAEALALTAGNQMALLYGATAPLSPQTKARELIFGSAEKRLLKEALNEYRNNGTKGFINNLTSSVKSAARSAVGFVEEGGKETVQENIQQVGEQEIVNANINELAGQKILKDTYTYQDFVNTSGLAFLSGGMIANAKIPNFAQDPNQRLINLVTLGSNPITFQSNLDELVKSGVATEKEAEALKNDAISTVRQIRKIPKDVDAETSLNLVRKLQEVENLEESKKVIAKPFHQKIDEQINGLNTEITDIYNKRLDVEVERLKTLTSQTNAEEFGEGAINNGEAYNVIDTKEESAKAAENWFVNNNRQDELYEIDDNGNKVKINFESQPAIVLPNGQIIINREIAREVDEGASAGRHELLHKILKSQFNDPIKADELLNKFKGVLSAQENLVVEQRLKDRGYTKEYLSKNQDEYLTQFFEALENKEITATDATFKSMWKSIFRPIYKVLGFEKLDFESGNDIYQFLKDYHKTSKAGKLTSRQKTLLEAGKSIIGTTASSKSASELVKEKIADLEDNEGDYDPDEYDQEVRKLEGELKRAIAKEATTQPTIKKEVSEEDAVKEIIKNESGSISSNKVQQIYETKGKEGAAEIIKLFKPITNKIVDKRRDAPDFDRELLTDEIETGVGGILDLITKYKPESGTPLAAWINKYLPVRAIATSRRILGKQFSKDASEEKGLMATETADQGFAETAKEKPKYKNVLESKVFAPEVLETATKKIVTITRTLKSRIDAPVSLNKTVTPLISEIRDEVGKQLDIDVKTAMGGKKDNQLQNWLLDNKQYVLENMTTTWLMGKDGQGGMPIAIQKQIDGKWTNFPEWVGKKVDREKTTTDQAGRTSGAELVRRLPNVNNNISDSQFLDQIIGPDGNPLRGRKESLAKAIAEEAAFDIINDDIENDGPISEAFKANQERQGVEITNTFAIEVVRQIERGNIKYSKASKDTEAIALAKESLFEWTKTLNPKEYNVIKAYLGYIKRDENFTTKSPILKQYLVYARRLEAANQDNLGSLANRLGSIESEEALERVIKANKDNDKNLTDALTGFLRSEVKSYKTNNGNFITTNKEYLTYVLQPVLDKIIGVEKTDKLFEDKVLGLLETEVDGKPRSYILINEKRLDSYTPITNIKTIFSKNKSNVVKLRNDINEEADLAATHVLKTVTYYRNLGGSKNIEKGLNHITLLGTDMQGSLRKMYKMGFYISGLKNDDIILEHNTTINDLKKVLIKYLNKEIDLPELKRYVKTLKVNLIPKVADQALTDAKLKETGENRNENLEFIEALAPFQKSLHDITTMYKSKASFDRLIKAATIGIGAKQTRLNNETISAVVRSIKLSKTPKGISVFDFDDTVGLTKGSVLYTMPDGSKGKLNAEEFAKDGSSVLDAGGTFDFSEFSKVVDGKPGPMVEKMKKMITKFGPENFFILTARPANAAVPIHEFLSSIGIDIPLENITGLGSSLAQSKADWMTAKAAEGYNDFYFSDDAIQNVTAVKNALDVLDVKSKIQQAKIKFSKSISSEFNKIIAKNTGIGPAISYSDIVAKRKGAGKNLFDIYVPASAADFELLLYNFIGKGKEGEAQKEFFTNALLKPYANGNDLMDATRQSIKNNYKELINAFPGIAKKLEKLTPDGNFTYDQALRVAMWNGADIEIPGLSKRDTNELTSLVNNDTELYDFMSGLIVLGRQGNGWTKPGENWDASTIISDLHNLTEGEGRKQFLTEFIDNAEEMFGKWDNGRLTGPNMNKIEAIYGTDVRESIEDVLYRMSTGKNRAQGTDKITNKWLNWVSGSTGTIMFLNTRSAALQLIGAVNFLNLRDNNPIAAAAAFANQKQYWTDFARIWNSDKMKERRGGLKEDVAAAEIANAAATSRNKPTAVVSYLLKIGYTPTQLADSFAIASGGAPFYRNRIKSYLKEGQTEAEAEKNAWNDFTKVSDETQQSGDPRDISKQQASGAGRLLLTFQNTAMQQSRIVKKSFLDLKNGRGDAKTHIAKITYYLAIQNLMFSALQQGLFAIAFTGDHGGEDEDEFDEEKKKRLKEKDKKLVEIANGVIDTVVRGTGLLGGVMVTLKNVIKKYMEEEPKKYKADYTKVLLEGVNISPPIGSKIRKVYTGLQQTKFDRDLIKERGWGVMQDGRVHLGPMYSITGKVVEATANLPMDRLVAKVENVSQAMNSQNKAWQRVMVGMGWTPRSVGIGDTEGDIKIEATAKEVRKEEGKIKGAETRARTKDSIKALPIARRIEIKREAALKRREEKIKKREAANKKRKMG